MTNLSAFEDSGWIQFSPGINLIVGQNNSGKSALLRALDLALADDRRRTAKEYRLERLPQPTVESDIVVSGTEVENAILQFNGQIQWPTQAPNTDEALRLVNLYLSEPVHTFELLRRPGQSFSSRRRPSHGQFVGQVERFVVLQASDGRIAPAGFGGGNADNMVSIIDRVWHSHVFIFDAQRFSLGKSSFAREERLNPNASNLAAILSKLSGDQRNLFDRLVGHLREVFSTVRNLSVTPISSGFEIRVWSTEDILRAELGFPLDNCGTGVAQVIAILTVAMTFDRAVIVIDEISSFLHPAAAKALLRIIQTNYSQHQYIISTHSPEVLSSCNPATVHVVRRQEYDSFVQRIKFDELDQIRNVADELGISMTDVFAADRIIWVEGRTEESCFPHIFKETVGQGQMPLGVTFAAVVATGDFTAKNNRCELIFQIYRQLSSATSPLVKSVTFGFDRESLSEQQMTDLKREAKGRLLFLPRRHFECFLLDPDAIACLINEYAPDAANQTFPADVESSMQKIGNDPKYLAAKEWDGSIRNESWLTEVDAANLLRDLCGTLSDGRISYVKTRHSFDLLKHILTHNRNTLDGLISYVQELLKLA